MAPIEDTGFRPVYNSASLPAVFIIDPSLV